MVRPAPTARAATALLLALFLVLVAVGCTRSEPKAQAVRAALPPTTLAPLPPPPPTAPPNSVVATATVPSVDVFAEPAGATPSSSFSNPTDYYVEPLVFLVKQARDEWLEVFLPARPNGSTGWVRAADVALSETDWRLQVDLDDHRLTVWKGADVVREETVAIGTDSAPTPTGEYYLTERLDTGNPRGPYGPWAFGLSAYSDVHTSFAGGPGQVGLHGTNDPSSLGRSVSNGCVRITNDAITALAAELPVGSPISIVA